MCEREERREEREEKREEREEKRRESLIKIINSIYYIIMTNDQKTPPVGLEPTTVRLRAARSTDWARTAYQYREEDLINNKTRQDK